DLLRSQVSAVRYRVAVINQSTEVTDDEVRAVVSALETQVHRDFAPAWGVDADLIFVPKKEKPPADCWSMVVRDDTDKEGALGYRDLNSEGLPRARVFVRSARAARYNWTVTISHVLLEMLANPKGNRIIERELSAGQSRFYPQEVC